MNSAPKTSPLLYRSSYFFITLLFFLIIWAQYGFEGLFHSAIVLDWDEAAHLYIANDWLNGGTPYVSSWDTKGPLLSLPLMGFIEVCQSKMPCHRVLMSLFQILSTSLFFCFCGLRYGAWPALAASLIYGPIFAFSLNDAIVIQSENIMLLYCSLLFLLIAVFEKLRYQALHYYLIGVIFTGIFLTKHLGIALCLPSLLLLNSNQIKQKLKSILFGGVSSFIAVLLIFTYIGSFDEFIKTYFYVSANRGITLSFAETNSRFIKLISAFYENMQIPIVFCAIATVALLSTKLYEQQKNVNQTILFPFSVIIMGVFSIYIQQFGFMHYALTLKLGISILIASALAKMQAKSLQIIITIALTGFLFLHYSNYLVQINNARYRFPVDQNLIDTANFIKSHTDHNAKIYIASPDPILYLLSERQSFIKFFFWQHLTPMWQGHAFDPREIQKKFINEPPCLLVNDMNLAVSKDIDSEQTFLTNIISQNYQKLQIIGRHTIWTPKITPHSCFKNTNARHS